MDLGIHDLSLAVPTDFEAEEVTASYRVAFKPDLKDPRVLQAQMPIRPNLIINRRRVAAEQEVGALVAEVCANLVRHIDGLSQIDTDEFTFSDGQVGLLIKYTVDAHQKFKLAQLQAARLDGDVFTTLTISTEVSRLTPDVLDGYLNCFASATPKA